MKDYSAVFTVLYRAQFILLGISVSFVLWSILTRNTSDEILSIYGVGIYGTVGAFIALVLLWAVSDRSNALMRANKMFGWISGITIPVHVVLFVLTLPYRHEPVIGLAFLPLLFTWFLIWPCLAWLGVVVFLRIRYPKAKLFHTLSGLKEQ